MINSRSIEDLHPRVREKCIAYQKACGAAGIDIIITSTLRDAESQNALYAQGRTAPGKIVTRVKGGYSFHNFGVAFDFVPIVNGKAVWNDNDLWAKCGSIGRAVGLEWGGDWRTFVDKPHMQDTGGFKIADYLAGKAFTT